MPETMTEEQMRDSDAPWPKTIGELNKYIQKLGSMPHDYGSCVYAVSLAATATFNYMSHQLGITGFQASCADLDVLKRTRGMKGSFMLIKAEDMLYPQSDHMISDLKEFREKQTGWLKSEAKKLLKQSLGAHPEVVAHWKKLAKGESCQSKP